jgi:protein-S-isoprenylcysteine O-methyltransferase Ste14
MQPRIKPIQLTLYLFIFVTAPTLTFILGSWLDNFLNLPLFPVFPFNLFLGTIVMIIGLNLGIKSTRQLYHAGLGLPWGSVTPEVESQILVVDGLYKYSRNPMVLGYSILPLGMGLMFQSIGMVISLTPAVLVLNYILVKTREEPRLLERFGENYKGYQKKTPFLFPKWRILFNDFVLQYFQYHWNLIIYVLLAELSLMVTSLVVFQDLPMYKFGGQVFVSKLLFSAICVLGIIAGISPKWCSFGMSSERRGRDDVGGHHPNCGHFPGHVVVLGNRIFCAGCSGLILGAVLALIGLSLEIYPLTILDGFWFGVLLVGLGLSQHFIDLSSGFIHLTLNSLFVVGAWAMFMAIQFMNLSFLVTVYFLIVTIFWIYARIRASQWTHVGVCKDCGVICLNRFE